MASEATAAVARLNGSIPTLTGRDIRPAGGSLRDWPSHPGPCPLLWVLQALAGGRHGPHHRPLKASEASRAIRLFVGWHLDYPDDHPERSFWIRREPSGATSHPT